MSRDRLDRARRRELELEASPEGCAAACHAALREGESERAQGYLRGALEAFPQAPELLQIARELSPGDPWPATGGRGGRRAGPFPGPERGVQSWRVDLPRSPGFEPVVDAEGGVWAHAREGLVRLDRSGVRETLVSARDAFPFRLEAGRPSWYDPHLGELSSSNGWRYVRAESGEVVAWEGDQLEGTGGGGLGWRRRISNVWRVAAGRRAFVVLYSGSGSMNGIDVQLADLASGERLAAHRSLEADFQASWYQAAAVPGAQERFLISSGRRLGLYDAELRPIWERSQPHVKFACDGHVVALAGEGGLRVLDLEGGTTRWARPELDLYGAPTLDGRGWVYVISGGSLLCFDGAGERRLRVSLGALGPLGSPALGGPGQLYLSAGKSVVCVV